MRFVVLTLVATALATAAPATAAAPNYIMVTGPGLPKPVVLSSWEENLALVSASASGRGVAPSTARALAKRPRFRLWFFWAWGEQPPPTTTAGANQGGYFYPAYGSRRPVITILDGVNVPRFAPGEVIEIFKRHGVPTRVAARRAKPRV